MVTSKWIYKIMHVTDGSIDKYKVLFVARGFSEKELEDYDETFSPVSRYTSNRSIIFLVASLRWNLHHMYVKTSFRNGVIEEEVYIDYPHSFEVHGKEYHVCRLKRILY